MGQAVESDVDAVLDAFERHDFSNPLDPNTQHERQCDVVMKGGITSGVVYPLAVLELAKTYRFRAIGGTSVGALAAAVTAAAEYGRDKRGFNHLVTAVRQLQQPGFVANVFQPAPELRPLLALLFLSLKLKRRAKLKRDQGRAVRRAQSGSAHDARAVERLADEMPTQGEIAQDLLKLLVSLTTARAHLPAILSGILGALLGALIGGGWIAAALTATSGAAATRLLIWGVLLIALLWWIGHALGTIWWLVFQAIPHNGFGICSGRPVPDHNAHRLIPAPVDQSPALTDWLAATIDTLAGVSGGPLTFKQLREHQPAPPQKDSNNPPLPRDITLNTVTTNLSQGQPYTLPFTDPQFLFSKQEWELLFPHEVVKHMIDHAATRAEFTYPIEIEDAHGAPQNLYFFPDEKDLPVVVAARMSLSFPLLLSAVPLWTISRTAFTSQEYHAVRSKGEPFTLTCAHVRCNWFSDGGTCSNFPIHFYDRLFPSHPTFGINLGDALDQPYKGAFLQPDEQWEEPVELRTAGVPEPIAPRDPPPPSTSAILPSAYPRDRSGPLWTQIDGGLFGFVGSIINTGLFYRDILQARLPSYYDRTVTVLLTESEGGLNLDMPPATIRRVATKGQQAGQVIAERFNFDHHRWVRLRLLLSQLEQQMIALSTPLQFSAAPVDRAQLRNQLETLRDFLQRSGITRNAVQELITKQLTSYPAEAQRFPFAADQDWVNTTLSRLYALLLLIEVWGGEEHALFQLTSADIPSADVTDDRDHIRLRVTPEL